MFESRSPIVPETASVTPENHLAIGGTGVAELVERFGSPLYVFDEATLRGQCRRFVEEFSARYPNVLVAYAAKAFLTRPLARILAGAGLGLDVVSAGDLAIARSAGSRPAPAYFPGHHPTHDRLL